MGASQNNRKTKVLRPMRSQFKVLDSGIFDGRRGLEPNGKIPHLLYTQVKLAISHGAVLGLVPYQSRGLVPGHDWFFRLLDFFHLPMP
jgi:hypothetical protein